MGWRATNGKELLPCRRTMTATLQRQSPGAVGQIYRAIESGQQISQAELDEGDQELCMLVRLWPTLFLDEQGILRTTVTKPGRNVHPAICPPLMRTEVIWRCHQMAHSGASRTTERLRLSWYWYGMVSMVRRTLSTCEVCQAAKHGKLLSTTGTRHLYSGRPWQWVAIDLVGPMPLTPRGNRWILVLSDHFPVGQKPCRYLMPRHPLSLQPYIQRYSHGLEYRSNFTATRGLNLSRD